MPSPPFLFLGIAGGRKPPAPHRSCCAKAGRPKAFSSRLDLLTPIEKPSLPLGHPSPKYQCNDHCFVALDRHNPPNGLGMDAAYLQGIDGRCRAYYEQGENGPESPVKLGVSEKPLGEDKRDLSHDVAERRMYIWGRLDPTIATISRWADDDPEAMQKLLSDPLLQRQVLDALTSLAIAEKPIDEKATG
jgi:hypothetical protein